MAKDPNDAINDFLGDLKDSSESNGFEENQEEAFAEQPAEPIEEEVVEEKSLPFNKDPKIQKYLEKEMNKLRDEFSQKRTIQEEPKNTDATDVVSAFEAIIGNDTPEKLVALKSLERALGNVDQRASEKAIAKLEELRSQELQADKEAEQELENAFDEIEDTYGVDITSNTANAKKVRSEFISFVEKIAPKRNGEIVEYPDMTSAWETFSEIRKASQQPSRAKELASRGMTRSSDAQVTGPQKRVSFDDADAYIESLKN